MEQEGKEGECWEQITQAAAGVGLFPAGVASLLGLGFCSACRVVHSTSSGLPVCFSESNSEKHLADEEPKTQGLSSRVGIATNFTPELVLSHDLMNLIWAGL